MSEEAIKCPCGGALTLMEWGTYLDETPIDQEGYIVREDRVTVEDMQKGYKVECAECGLVLAAKIENDRITLEE